MKNYVGIEQNVGVKVSGGNISMLVFCCSTHTRTHARTHIYVYTSLQETLIIRSTLVIDYQLLSKFLDRLCSLVVKVLGYTSRGSSSIPSATTFSEKWWVWNGLHPTIEELLKRKSSGFGLENQDYGRRGSSSLTTRHPSIRKSWK
jgi:hypothetical protein